MSNENISRTKPLINIGTIGHDDHGKTTLTAVLTKISAERFGGKFTAYNQIKAPTRESVRGISIATARVEYESPSRHYIHIDCPSNADNVKNLIAGMMPMDAAILVCSAAEGPMSQTHEHILLARQVGVPYIVIYLNKVDIIAENVELVELIEMELRELLNYHGFPGDGTPIIIGSALKALEGDKSNIGVPSIIKLVETLDNYIPIPERPVDKQFLMPIMDVFTMAGRGTVVTGKVERGVIKINDSIEIVGLRNTRPSRCTALEAFNKSLDQGQAGDVVGVILQQPINIKELERGMVLAWPGSIKSHTYFETVIYMLSVEEGGRKTPFFSGHRLQFYFRTIDVSGVVELPNENGKVMPGDNIKLKVKLALAIAMEVGLRITIREGGRTVGSGVISKIIE